MTGFQFKFKVEKPTLKNLLVKKKIKGANEDLHFQNKVNKKCH